MRLAAVIPFLAAAVLTTQSIAADSRSFVVQNQNDDLSIQRVWTAAAATVPTPTPTTSRSPTAVAHMSATRRRRSGGRGAVPCDGAAQERAQADHGDGEDEVQPVVGVVDRDDVHGAVGDR